MKTIWKFPIKVTDEQAISMPGDARVLCVQKQNGVPCLWAEVSDTAAVVPHLFCVYGTGYRMPEDPGTYIGTFQLDSGKFVFHVYREGAE